MPGYIIHLAAARLALDKLGFSDFDKCFKVYVGSVLADTMARQDKRESHFWSDESMRLLKRVPELDVFLEKYKSKKDNPIAAAYGAHLYMDRKFVNDYWTRHFEFYNDEEKTEEGYDEITLVRLKDTGELFSRSEFFSDEYFYGDYTRLLPYITKKYGLKEIFAGYSLDEIRQRLDGLDCSVIEEIKGQDYKKQIMGMFENIYNIEASDFADLKVFRLGELEELIGDTAAFLAQA